MFKNINLKHLNRSLSEAIKKEKYLVTGAQGFIGSWILKRLVEKGNDVLGIDLKIKPDILEQICSFKELKKIKLSQCNITDFNALREIFHHYEPTYILHLAGAQVPICKQIPSFGALINIIGTSNIFDISKSQDSVKSVVYASSAAVCGPSEDYSRQAITEYDFHLPRTLYGVYKQTTEEIARIFWQDHQLSSAGFRPLVCYGPGREFGISSDPTKAIKSAVMNSSFEVSFKGPTVFNFAPDVADCFIESCKILSKKTGNFLCNISHVSSTVEKFLEIIFDILPNSKYKISIKNDAKVLPFPEFFKESSLKKFFDNNIAKTSLRDGIFQTIKVFNRLRKENRLYVNEL